MSTESQKGTKSPITLKIKFKSGSLEQFIERYSVDVSRGGIFIRTKEPLAVGTALKFEFQLQDATPLISGDGTVVWNRAYDPARQNVAPGMGVRFDKLTPDSERVLGRILAEKEKRGDTAMESRFDAGVRAATGDGGEAAPPQTSQETPKNGMFGDEPTRAMAADQVNRLAESIKAGTYEEDQPTRRGSLSDFGEDVRRLAGQSGEGSGSLPAIPTSGIPTSQKLSNMQPMAPIKKPDGMRSTLLGQGFGLGNATPMSLPGGGAAPQPGFPPAASPAAPPARDPSGAMPAAQVAVADSAVTPVKAADAAAVAESQRTPTGSAVEGLSKPAAPAPTPVAPTPAPVAPTPVAPVTTPPAAAASGSATPAAISTPAAGPVAVEMPAKAAQSQPSAAPISTTPAATPAPPADQAGGSSKGLFIGAAVLVLLVAVAGYFVLQGQKPGPGGSTGSGPVTGSGVQNTQPNDPPPQPPPPQPLALIPEKPIAPPPGDGQKPGTEAGKADGTKPAGDAADGVSQEITSDPPGAQVELAGKVIGTTPTRLPGLAAGKTYDIKVTLHGFQEVKQKVKLAEDNKAIEIKLLPIERQVEIASVPKGADVYVDGKKVGRTPWILRKIDLSKAPKTLKVEVRKAGFETWTHNVTDTEAFQLRNKKEVLSLNAVLEAAAKKGGRPAAPVKKADPEKASDGAAAPAGAEPAAPAPKAEKAEDAPKPAEAKPAAAAAAAAEEAKPAAQ